jgi:Zn-dependent protease with chaperone function
VDFFEQQSRAKSNSTKLYFLFGFVVLIVSLMVFCLLSWQIEQDKDLKDFAWTPTFLIVTIFVVSTLIISVSLSKIKELAGGGWVIANALGGQLVTSHTQNPLKRRILNVVEEMAIASGIAVPPVYILEENSINAFAAGFSSEDAVIGVTVGCLEKLNREQLQGVMAHEFSHILNGDMRINIRMTGIIFGIVFIARIGRSIMDSCEESNHVKSEEDDGSGLYILGLGLFIIGIFGGYLGAIIRSAVSRQREYLADASAVQFTRNPDGITGALECIGGFSKGSRIWNPRSREFCHMFFGPCMKNLLATHPPLVKRIKRINPRWNRTFPNTNKLSEGKVFESNNFNSSHFSNGHASHESKRVNTSTGASQKKISTRNLKKENLVYARKILNEIPQRIKMQTEDPFGSSCLLFAMLLDQNQVIRNKQIKKITLLANSNTSEYTKKIWPQLKVINCEEKFALIEKAGSQLLQFSSNQLARFDSVINMLVKEDNKLQLFEWSLFKVIENKIKHLKKPSMSIHGRLGVMSRLTECSLILGTLAHHGQDNLDPQPAFNQGFEHLTLKRKSDLPKKEDCTFSKLDMALSRLNQLTPLDKRTLIEACEYTIHHDTKTTDIEIQIIRGVASSLACPIGPLMKIK